MANRKIGALWLRKSKDGLSFLSGVVQDMRGDINIAVFKNDRKEKDNQPDYNIVLSEPREEKRPARADNFFGGDQAEKLPTGEFPADDEINVDNIPFG